MQAALFSAGLGDVIQNIYRTAAYRFISETREPVPVIVASHNPFTMEIFRFHRNARNFLLYDLAHKYEEFLDAGLRGWEIDRALVEFVGLQYKDLVRGGARDFRPEFDAPDTLPSSGHIVFQPFSGNANYRTLPVEAIEKIVTLLRAQPRQVFLITRSYIRSAGGGGKVIHTEENAQRFAGGNITVLEHLSVPATLNLIRSSAGFVGSWSSLQQAAWLENKPVAVYYPEGFTQIKEGSHYAFGIHRDDCVHAEYSSLDLEKLRAWLVNLR